VQTLRAQTQQLTKNRHRAAKNRRTNIDKENSGEELKLFEEKEFL